MKTSLLLLPMFACALLSLSSCTTSPTTANKKPGATETEDVRNRKSSYTQEELQKRGGPTVADSLEAQDASVRIDSRGGR